MKNILKFVLVLALTVSFTSCGDDEKVVDGVFDGVTSGAVLRTITLISNEIAIGAVEPQMFGVEIEEQDAQEGALLESVDVFITFTDASAGTTTTEALVENIPASEFSTDTPFGLPRTTIMYSFAEMLSASGVDEGDTFGGDSFSVRLALNLTDGRVFTDSNTAGVVTGGFFASPFRYRVNLVCEVPSDYFIGAYTVQRTSPGTNPFLGCCGVAWDPAPQAITIDGSGASRNFVYSYFPDPVIGFQFPQAITMTLSCGDLFFAGTSVSGTLGCGGGTITQGDTDPPATYSLGNDTDFEIEIVDFADDAGCGTGSYNVTLRFIKQ